METHASASPDPVHQERLRALRLDLIGLAHDEARAGRLDTAIDLYAEAGASAYLTTLGSEALAAGNVRVAIRAFTAIEWEIPRQALLDSVEERLARENEEKPKPASMLTNIVGLIATAFAFPALLYVMVRLQSDAETALIVVLAMTTLLLLMCMFADITNRPRTSRTEHVASDHATQERSRHIQKALREFREARTACPTPEV